jgi:fibronectin type 3 domain-containing protein
VKHLPFLALLFVAACGAKGDPLPPFRPVPAAAENLFVTRMPGAPIALRFNLPAANADNTALDLTAVEIHAVMRPSTGKAPEPTDVGGRGNRIATIDVANAAPSAEMVWEDTSEAATTPTALTIRYYAVVGVSKHGRRGPASQAAGVPLAAFPPAPSKLSASTTESGIKLDWLGTTIGVGYRVFEVKDGKPQSKSLNDTPLKSTTFDDPRMEFGVERCYLVRAAEDVVPVSGAALSTAAPVAASGAKSNASVESEPSNTVCVTPKDVFPPPAPANLSAVGGTGAISLIWDAVEASDLAGYLVLRAEAPGDKLTPLFDTPITDTTYKDATTKPGTRYVYAIVAVDKATPANRSAESNRVEETGRN